MAPCIGLCCVVALTMNLVAYTLGMCRSSVLPNDRSVIACEQQILKEKLNEVVSDCPSISSIRKFRLHEEIPLTETDILTSALLNDERGFWFEHIRYNKKDGSYADINAEMFCRWLACYGKQPVTWIALIVALRDVIQLTELAQKLIDAIPPKSLNVTVDCRLRPTLRYPIINPPDILLLQHLNVSICDEIVGVKNFGTALLNDKHKHKMSNILKMHKRVHDINLNILEQWLLRNGRIPVTWKTLITTLHDIKLEELADDVQKLIHFKAMNNSALPFAHSEAILNMTLILKNKYCSEQPSLIQNYSAYPITLQFYKHKETLNLDEYIITNQISPKRLLITSQLYSSNKILIWLIAREWAESRYRFSCQVLLRINLGKCEQKYHNLHSLLKDHYGSLFDNTDRISKDIQGVHGEGFCMLLDCFHCKKLKRDFIYDVIYNGKLPNALCIIFSQPGEDRQLVEIATLHTNVRFLMETVKDYTAQIASDQCINGDMKHKWLDIVLKECWRQPYLHVIVTTQ